MIYSTRQTCTYTHRKPLKQVSIILQVAVNESLVRFQLGFLLLPILELLTSVHSFITARFLIDVRS